MPGQIAEIIVALDGKPGRRGSGYRVGPGVVLTAAHVIDGAVSIRVRFDADLPGEWVTEATSCWTDPRSDLAVLSIAPREGESAVAVPRFGRISDRAAVLAARAVGFPRFKLKNDDGTDADDDRPRYRDSHQADGSVAVLSNRREGTLEVTVPRPERDPDPGVSPWRGMSGAAVWIGDRIAGVIANHHRSDGLGRLAAARLDLALEGLDQGRRDELRALLDLPEVLPDVVPPSVGERVRTAYQAQVRDIAPDHLLDRDAELDELVGFCAGDQPYAWWQAGPWAGKSALMAWFVLHPPAGVDVVSFFVTARLAGQSDSDACTDALIEQLAALVGESPAGLLTAGARRGTMLRLLEDAAGRAREAGRRLLLVIDGLDEDSGTAAGPGRPSIAALLPRRPPPEVRVLVASRPHPPIPDDVAGDHPLRTISPWQLTVSEHARDVEYRARHELTQLLAGSQLQRDVLGLIIAAGGGLTLDDLEELTEQPPYEIEGLLGGLFGRSVGSRIGATSAGYPDERVYLFTHETLRLVAEQQYGNSLAAYRDRLHTWADTYRQWGWPANTPHYLLRSYPRMLASSGGLPRLTACATDQVRHDRMRDLTGGDALAYTEISIAQQLILAQSDPDLTSLALLAVQREHLTDRNSNIPIALPAVWARIGQPTRAEALANSIPDIARRAEMLAQIAQAVAAVGDHERVARLATKSEALTAQITHPELQAEALARVAVAIAAVGDYGRAARLATKVETLTAQITDPDRRARVLVDVAVVMATSGDHSRAEALTAQITPPDWRAEALARVAVVLTTAGDHDRAEALTAQITYPGRPARALADVAVVVATGGDHDQAARLASEAEALTAQITDPDWRAWVLADVAVVMATGGDQDRAARLATEAETLTAQITDPDRRANVSARVAVVTAAGGDHDRAARLATEAETLTAQITLSGLQADVLARVAVVLATGGDHHRAEVLTAQIAHPKQRAEALARVAEVVAIGGDHDRAARLATKAEALTAQIAHPEQRARALVDVAVAMATGGDHDRAARLATEAETLTAQISLPYLQTDVLARVAVVLATGGNHHRAEVLTAQITHPEQRARALAHVAVAMAAGGDHDRAARLATKAETLTAQITDPYSRAKVLARVAVAMATGGDHDRAARLATKAETLTAQITDPYSRAEALARVAVAMATGGDHDQAARLATKAEALTAQITHPEQQAKALVRRTMALVETIENTSPRGHLCRSSPVVVRARHLFAWVLTTSSWMGVVSDLARVDPLAITFLADELLVR